MLIDQKAEAQTVLDELWNEELIPFPLTVGKITEDDTEYTIHFHDSRIRTAIFSVTEGQPFGEGVRTAVLERVAKMSGALADWRAGKPTTAEGSS